jgi:hypothetical protein
LGEDRRPDQRPHVFAARFGNVGLVEFDQPRDGCPCAGQCRRGRFALARRGHLLVFAVCGIRPLRVELARSPNSLSAFAAIAGCQLI